MTHRDPIDALHAVLLGLPGGIAAAAKKIGRSPGTMHNKFSEAITTNEVTAREALALADYAQTTVYAEAVCEHFGGVFIVLPTGPAGDDDVLQSYLAIIQQMGELSKEFSDARADGLIDPKEFSALKLRGYRTISAIQLMLAEIETTVRELPSQPLVSVKKAS
ncbi:phage regulatory CII family protein [Dechloromonas sp. CZR5]|uniref:phage regulatory CII family protein n=1 Tax=Dechloromonas sp. CZR5 TaxID=2608630 RepID=UPI00123D10C5|nr:phage regulatory CII family protein [Dechloromonas sp. CZR5]